MSVRVEFRWSEELLARVDAAASFESRASWVRRAVERALVTEPRGSEDARVSYAEPPAPAEQPEDVERALEGLDHSPCRVDVGDRDPVPAPAEQPENQYVSVYDHNENAELPEGDEFARGPKFGTFPVQPERRVSPPKLVSPRVPFRRDVKPFQRGDK